MGLYTCTTQVAHEVVLGERTNRALVSQIFTVSEDVQAAFDRYSLTGWPKYKGIQETPVYVDPQKIAAIEYHNNLPFRTANDHSGSFLTTLTSNFVMVAEFPDAVMAQLEKYDFVKLQKYDPENSALNHSDVFIKRGAVRAVTDLANGKAAAAIFSGYSIRVEHEPQRMAELLGTKFISNWEHIQKVKDTDVPLLAERIAAISALEHRR